MPVYEYTALNARGKSVTGIIDAESAMIARQKLRGSRIFPVSVQETRRSPEKKSGWMTTLSQSFARVRPSEVALMTRQLATLVGAGFPLVTALDTMIPQIKAPAFKRIMAQIKDSVVEGNSFAAALAPYPGVFSPVYVNMVRAGETSGTLEIVLDRLADIAEKQQALSTRIKTALAYPTLMGVIGVLVLFFLLAFIVPSIASIFEDMGQALPTPTRILILVSDFLKTYWWVVLGGMAVGGFAARRYQKTPAGRRLWDRWALRAPGVGGLVRKLAAARFTRTLASLLANGVTLLAALEIVENIVDNVHLSEAISRAAEEVGKGQAFGPSLAESGLFPSLAIQMIQVGEQSGELEPMLEKVADVFENEVESTVMSLTSLLEPVMILVMAVIVGFIVLSICLPIFEMNELVR